MKNWSIVSHFSSAYANDRLLHRSAFGWAGLTSWRAGSLTHSNRIHAINSMMHHPAFISASTSFLHCRPWPFQVPSFKETSKYTYNCLSSLNDELPLPTSIFVVSIGPLVFCLSPEKLSLTRSIVHKYRNCKYTKTEKITKRRNFGIFLCICAFLFHECVVCDPPSTIDTNTQIDNT